MGKESLDKKQAKGMESKEAEKLPPVLLIYRSNELFKKYVPEIADNLKSMDRDVEIHEFPLGTKEEEIKKWLMENIEKLKDKEILPDGTVGWKILNDFELHRAGCPSLEKGFIDDILANSTTRVLFEKNYDYWKKEGDDKDYEKSMEATEKSFVTLVEKIMENHEPEKVHIFLQKILEHGPFAHLWIKKLKEGSETTKEDHQLAGGKIKDWLVKAGINQEKIVLRDDFQDLKDVEGNSQEIKNSIEEIKGGSNNWIILDRHLLGDIEKELGKIKTDSTILELPLEDFLPDALNNNLLQIDPSKIEEALKETLKEKFTTEEE